MIIILLLLIFTLLIYNFYIYYGRDGRLINRIPGPSSYSIVKKFLQSSQQNIWKLHVIIFDQYYPIFKIWFFFRPVVCIRHPDDIEIILKKHIEKSFIYNVLHPWFSTSLLTSGGAKWQSRRKIINPTFHFVILQQFVENVFNKQSKDMVNSLKNMGDPIVKDLMLFVSEYTLNTICDAGTSTSLRKYFDSLQQQYRHAVDKMFEFVIYRGLRPWLYHDWIFALTSKSRQQRRFLKIINGFSQKIIAERKLYHEQINGQYMKTCDKVALAEENNSETIIIKKKQLAVLDFLIAASRESYLTDSDIQGEINTFIAAGYDTTAMTICFTLLLLAEHKDIQDRVREEVNTVMRESEEKFTMQSLLKLSYLERCIKEALRLYPIAYFISRVTSEDVKLQSYLVPVGTTVIISIHGVQRDPNYWPNPEIFDPDRFLPENIRNQHPCAYLPFSGGPRNCIGQRFALLEMKSMIASVIYNFHLEPIENLKDIQLNGDMLMRPANPLRLKFIPITKTHIDI
ncbi:cytochrome P450 4C1-like [Pogonomyrmex barbatus]|uniref:Cytochrome P450 4C1-like n=1 Tax=Pogonomyrmex barbatus TaxID=144034 RepID=A0A6I9X276_9HYME|nr:cytochrome P450 4C1-like [Pogonomyrmex barbatus]